MIRVLIVDDSAVVRKAIADHLRAAGIDVVGEAASGREAVQMARVLRPDVVLTDLLMPGMDGVETTRHIMKEVPTRVLILTALADPQEHAAVREAFAAGALAVCAKPRGDLQSQERQWRRVVTAVRAALHVPASPNRSKMQGGATCRPVNASTASRSQRSRIVVIGASTGGPSAVRQILESLPKDLPATLFVAIHSSPSVSLPLAEWLDQYCSMTVAEARHGETFTPGNSRVYLPPAGTDLTIAGNKLLLSKPCGGSHFCSPNIDQLFFSAARSFGPQVAGILLTGMGADGAAGLKYIRDQGGRTVAQDEATCIVYGMPAAAVARQAAEQVLPLSSIGDYLLQVTGYRKSSDLCGEVRP